MPKYASIQPVHCDDHYIEAQRIISYHYLALSFAAHLEEEASMPLRLSAVKLGAALVIAANSINLVDTDIKPCF